VGAVIERERFADDRPNTTTQQKLDVSASVKCSKPACLSGLGLVPGSDDKPRKKEGPVSVRLKKHS
jgi:hypothetical protein